MSNNMRVKVNPRFLKIICNKLYDLNPAIIGTRELVQNSHDACIRAAVKPDIKVTLKSGMYNDLSGYWLIVDDNGDGMTADIIENEFLDLGGSYHINETEIGGFGFGAKPVLFSCAYWRVHSLNNEYSLTHLENGDDISKINHRDGTRVEIFIDEVEKPIYQSDVHKIIVMLYLSSLEVDLTLNARGIEFDGKIGFNHLDIQDKLDSVTDDFTARLMPEFIKQDISFSGFNIFRVGGLVQFVEQSNRSTNIRFDLKVNCRPEDDDYPLKLNREDLNWNIRKKVNKVIQRHDENPLTSANTFTHADEDKVYQDGRLLEGLRGYSNYTVNDEIGSDISNLWQALANTSDNKNDPIATLFVEYPDISANDRRILRSWTAIIRIVADISDKFGVGLTSNSIASRYYYKGRTFYLINPSEFVHIPDKEALLLALYHTAIHEASHFYHSSHNEVFTSKMDEISRIAAISIVEVLKPIKRTILRRFRSEDKE